MRLRCNRVKLSSLLSLQDLNKAKNGKKPPSPVNWLQCREEDSNGDICGKWRR